MLFLKGDCLEVMKTLKDKTIDCFICDLPYGCLTGGKEKKKRNEAGNGGVFGCAWDIKIDLTKFWEEVKRLAKADNTPVIHFCNTRFGAELIASNPSWFRYDLVWDKGRGVSFLSSNKMPMKSHEMIYIFSKKGAYYKRIDEIVEGKKAYNKPNDLKQNPENIYGITKRLPRKQEDGKRCVLSVINQFNCPSSRTKGNHPTQKPAELYKWLLQRYCPHGGTILDPTAGSFTSCFVAKELGLNPIGIEMNDAFYEKALSKMDNPPI
jgi:site-specific DNA-methyltransferase (adenine-specific)